MLEIKKLCIISMTLKEKDGVKVKVLVIQLCSTVCNPKDCRLPGSTVHGILQARILEWVTVPFSRGSSWPMNQTWVPHIASGDVLLASFTIWATREIPIGRNGHSLKEIISEQVQQKLPNWKSNRKKLNKRILLSKKVNNFKDVQHML